MLVSKEPRKTGCISAFSFFGQWPERAMASCHYNRQPWYDLYGWLGIDWALTVNKINTPLLQQKNVTGQSFFNGGCTIIQSSMHTLSAHSCKALLQVLERATKTWHPKYQCARGKHSQQRLTVVSCACKFSTLEIKKRGGGGGGGGGGEISL